MIKCELKIEFVFFSVSCPICNAEVPLHGRVFVDIDIEDFQQFLANHPQLFNDFLRRHRQEEEQEAQEAHQAVMDQLRRTIKRLGNVTARQRAVMNQLLQTIRRLENVIAMQRSPGAQSYDIPAYNLNMHVDEEGMLLSHVPEIIDEMDDIPEGHQDVLELPTLHLQMSINQNAITLSRLNDGDDE